MSDIQYVPISRTAPDLLEPLMDEEEKAWLSELAWDYAPVRSILVSYMSQRLLPGYVALLGHRAVAYAYFLVNQAKGTIGAIYASGAPRAREAVEELVSLTISGLKDTPGIERIEAQILPFHNLKLTAAFTRHGFDYYPRYFMELDPATLPTRIRSEAVLPGKVVPWDPACMSRAAEMIASSYGGQVDSRISQDYRTRAGCENYLRSLVENPGCGVFLPEGSFLCLDETGSPCGLIISCRISGTAGMIPQIAVHPSFQGQGIGNALMTSSVGRLKSSGFKSVGLTVTAENRHAFNWYRRWGFGIRKEFGAYVWQR